MKRTHLIVLAFLFNYVTATAQKTTSKIGIHGGLSSFNIKGFAGDKLFTGFTGGIYLVKPLSGCFDFQPELNFQMQGTKSNYIGNIGDMAGIRFEDKYRLNYLNLPVLFAYKIPKSVLKIYAGPQTGLLLSARLIHHAQDYESSKTDIKDNLNSFAFGGAYGLSVNLPDSKGNCIVLDGRFANEFTNLDKETGPNHWKNYGFTFTIGYCF